MPTALDPTTRESLLSAARRAARQAYCPYSRFHVGAAVLSDGHTFTGCNVENASYGLAMCAERVAILTAVAAGHRQIQAIAVTCPDSPPQEPPPTRMPCGACRQVLAEFCEDLPILLVDADDPGIAREVSLAALLPDQFHGRAVSGPV